MTDGFYVDVSGVGSITQLSDRGSVSVRVFPFGFSSEEASMTAYRERMLAGEYEAKDAKQSASWTDKTDTTGKKKRRATKASAKKKT